MVWTFHFNIELDIEALRVALARLKNFFTRRNANITLIIILLILLLLLLLLRLAKKLSKKDTNKYQNEKYLP
jgi:hypothetical protein